MPGLRNYGLNSDQVQAAISAAQHLGVQAKSANFTIDSTYVQALTQTTSASALTATIPLNLAIPDGSEMRFLQVGAGQLTFVPASGVTVYAPDGTQCARQLAAAALVKVSANTYLLTGDLQPVTPATGHATPTSSANGHVVGYQCNFAGSSYAPLTNPGEGPNTLNATLTFDNVKTFDTYSSIHAQYAGGGANAYARVLSSAAWQTGDRVFYGAGFFLPVGFKAAMQGEVSLIRWDNYATYNGTGDLGGICIWHNDKKARLKLGRYDLGTETIIIGPFDVPEGQWFWLEVEQYLSPDAGVAYSNVRIDNASIGTSTDANTYGRRIDFLRAGLDAIASGAQTQAIDLWWARQAVSATLIGR